MARVPQPNNENVVQSQIAQNLLRRMPPPAPGEDLMGMEAAARGRNNETPIDYSAESPTGKSIMGMAIGEEPSAPPMKLEASVSPMEEVVSGRSTASDSAPMSQAVKPKIQKATVGNGKYDIEYDLNKIRHMDEDGNPDPRLAIAGMDENIKRREAFIGHLKTMEPKLADDLDQFMGSKWVERKLNEGEPSLGRQRAKGMLNDFLKSKGLSDERAAELSNLIEKTKVGVPIRYWGK
jgi:hypothetical protein